MSHAADFFRKAIAACERLNAPALAPHKISARPPPAPSRTGAPLPTPPSTNSSPLCHAAVHHGGIGTTAAAIEAALARNSSSR